MGHYLALNDSTIYFLLLFSLVKIFRKLFEDGLALQRSRIRELRSYAKEKGKEYASQLENDIDSMEN